MFLAYIDPDTNTHTYIATADNTMPVIKDMYVICV
jgi:hypothetical protein